LRGLPSNCSALLGEALRHFDVARIPAPAANYAERPMGSPSDV
jgi:hypothetical protein